MRRLIASLVMLSACSARGPAPWPFSTGGEPSADRAIADAAMRMSRPEGAPSTEMLEAGSAPKWQPLPGAPTLAGWGIWGSGPGDIYVVGFPEDVGYILHYNGSVWTAPPPYFGSSRAGVWGSGPTDIYVSSDSSLYHSDGTGVWTTTIGDAGLARSIWGSGPDDVYVTGGENLWHLTGGVWRYEMPPSPTGVLLGVWGSSASDVYAVGFYNTILHSNGDGSWVSWAPPLDAGFQAWNAIWGSGPNDLYVVGNGIIHSTGGGVWNVQSTANNARAIWGRSPSDVFAVGGPGGVYHTDGSGAWTTEPSGVTYRLFGVWGTSSDVYVVGRGPMLHRGR